MSYPYLLTQTWYWLALFFSSHTTTVCTAVTEEVAHGLLFRPSACCVVLIRADIW